MKLSIYKREKQPGFVIRITILSILFSFIGQENIRVIISVKVFCYLDKLLCTYFSMKIKFLKRSTLLLVIAALPLFLYRPVYASGCCSAADRLAGNKCGAAAGCGANEWCSSSAGSCYSSTSPKFMCVRNASVCPYCISGTCSDTCVSDGGSCSDDGACCSGSSCKSGKCTASTTCATEGKTCSTSMPCCDSDAKCTNGVCQGSGVSCNGWW